MKITRDDVARHCGVSPSTVSNVINNIPRVSNEIREKVFKGIAELNYTPNESARRLGFRGRKSGKQERRLTGNIGCVVFSEYMFSDPYFARILEGMGQEIVRRRYRMAFTYTFYQLMDNPDLFLSAINPNRVDGITLINNPVVEQRFSESVKEKVCNVVAINCIDKTDMDSVNTDLFQGAIEAVKYLNSLGHKRIGFLGRVDFAEPRFDGYNAAIRTLGLSYDENIIEGRGPFLGYGQDAGFTYMNRIIEKSIVLPTSVFAASDGIAVGAMKALRNRGISIPGEISIMGFDDIPEAASVTPALTTMRVQKEEMGRIGAGRLIDHIENPEMKKARLTLPAELVERESCRKIKV